MNNDKEICPKVFAVYLPQFYETEHNNNWWGEGFTDWETLKRAESLFDGHLQPEIPMNDYYYDLTDTETMRWQSELAKKFGIDGFILYHYYFGDGNKELEKPAENLLHHTDIDMPFCFSWANPSWVRTWSKVRGEFWGERIEINNRDDDGVLILQNYGDKTTWENHFYYLLPFFKDPRYICVEGKPVFIFYGPSEIHCLEKMIDKWKNLSEINGLKGLYIICQDVYYNIEGMDAVLFSEPMRSIKKMQREGLLKVKNGVRCFDYSCFCKESLNTSALKGVKSYFGGACGYDTTPRRGENGEVLINNSPEVFQEYVVKLLKKAKRHEDEFIVINAWNEWGEGMHLEPDEKNGYAYLQGVCKAKKNVVEEIEYSHLEDTTIECDETDSEQSFLIRRLTALREIYSRWIDLLSEGKLSFKMMLEERGIKTVAIYGYGDLGRKLHYQLGKENIEVKYAIDQYVGNVKNGIKVYRKEEELPEADVIIVTAYEANSIRDELRSITQIPVMTIEELLS